MYGLKRHLNGEFNALKTALTMVGLLIFVGIIWLFYVFSQISAVYPPIKTYSFKTVSTQLENDIAEVVNIDSNLNFRITEVRGVEYPYRYYAELTVKKNSHIYKFDFNYQDSDHFWNRNEYADLDLIGAFDQTAKTGGEQLKDKGVITLIPIFERNLIKRLKMK